MVRIPFSFSLSPPEMDGEDPFLLLPLPLGEGWGEGL
jgi:hypothetical protein